MNNLVSVIIPMYNAEKYIKKCIESIQKQTYEQFELILVDDNSTDHTVDICTFYADNDLRINVYKNSENAGPAATRNKGLEVAKGDYISFVDADDWIHPCMLEKMHKTMKLYDADIIQCGHIRTRTEDIGIIIEETSQIKEMTGKEAVENLYNVKSVNPSVPYTVLWNKMYKKQIVENVTFPPHLLYEDQCFAYKCFYNSLKVVVISDKLYFYRNNKESLTAQEYSPRYYGDIIAHQEQMNFFRKNDEKELERIVLERYMEVIIQHYYRTKINECGIKYLIFLKWQVIKYYFQYLINPDIKLKRKLRLFVFMLSADLYMRMKK